MRLIRDCESTLCVEVYPYGDLRCRIHFSATRGRNSLTLQAVEGP